METRPYFILGDAAATATAGAIAGLAALGATGEGFNMLLAMLIGMVVGMAVVMPVFFAFAPFFGAMEIMIPVMFGGMLSGMCIAKAEAMRGLAVGDAVGWGALIGLFGLVITSIANARLRANA